MYIYTNSNCYLFCLAFSDMTNCTEIGMLESSLEAISTQMRVSPVTPAPPRNTLSTESENETGMLGYKVQTTHFHLLLLISFNFLFKILSNLPVINIRIQPNA